MVDITESCSCGATTHVRMESNMYAHDEMRAWRKDHKHEFPPTPRKRIPLVAKKIGGYPAGGVVNTNRPMTHNFPKRSRG